MADHPQPQLDPPRRRPGPRPSRPGEGRPSARTPRNREVLLRALRHGVGISTAAMICGIHYDTLMKWRAAEPEMEAAIQQAIAECRLIMSRRILRHSRRDWRAAAWWLEHRDPEYQPPAQRIIHELQELPADLSLEELRGLIALGQQPQLPTDPAIAIPYTSYEVVSEEDNNDW